jgi:hypothetical protein
MRIVLLHAPPWKIPRPGERSDVADGPPARVERPLIQDADFCTIPYGLLSLAAQALRAGHEVEVLNLSVFPWAEIERLLRDRPAELYGLNCLTINRRGVMAVARLVRRLHPAAHIAVGGPHVTALPDQFLAACPAVDTIVRCEGEATFLELIERLETGQSITGLAGAVVRQQGEFHAGPDREPIRDLDSLASPLDYFSQPHPDHFAWLPGTVHLLQQSGHVDSPRPFPLAGLRVGHARKGRAGTWAAISVDQRRHLHGSSPAGFGDLSRHRRAETELRLELRHPGGCFGRRVAGCDAQGRLPVAESGRRIGLA